MTKIFSILIISFFPIFITNIIWTVLFLSILISNGLQFFFRNRGLIETFTTSEYLKWILLIDFFWISFFFLYVYSRKKYRIDIDRHFLKSDQIEEPKICVVIPAYNEEKTIQQVVTDYRNHPFVKDVIIIDNNSDDNTVSLAKQCGAQVITKNENRGYAHSIVLGFKEALKSDVNLIAVTESDGTLSSIDLDKMLPYINHCDVVNGSRQLQILNEKDNARDSAMHIWGNYFLSKLLQLKYINFTHLGVVNLNDIGCMLRIFRRNALEKIINKLNYPGTDIPIGGVAFVVFLTLKCLENDLRVIEIPVTYRKRIGESKIGSEKKLKNIQGGLLDLWLILKY